MIDRTGSRSSSLHNSAIESALKRKNESLESLQSKLSELMSGAGTSATSEAAEASFSKMLSGGIQEVDQAVRSAENVHLEVVKGNLDFHEVTAQLKQSELTFQFAMQIRNKLIESYREVMRMGV